MIGIGVIGAGYWGPKHVRIFTELPGSRPVLVADTDPQRLATIASQYPAVRTTTDAAELIESDEVDAVVVATPVSTHAKLASAALRAGKHVLIEKPLAGCVAEAVELVGLAASERRVLMAGHTFVY